MATGAIPRVLSIAGSDSSGGAGVQADLKAFARCGVYGMCAITAVTAQSTTGVVALHAVPARIVRAQIEAVVADIGVDAVKIGMLANAAIARTVARCVRASVAPQTPIVLDPVLASTSGSELLTEEGVAILLSELLPLVTVLTPNRPEALRLIERANPNTAPPLEDAALAEGVRALGPRCVVLTGGHRRGGGDLYCDADQCVELGAEHHSALATHGSGCTHSAVLAAELAQGRTPLDAARTAAHHAASAVRDGLEEIGHGEGPVDVLGLARRHTR